jgi:stress response protein YsnF
MTSDSTLPPVIGATADDRDGNALGTITTVFLDDVTGQPTWVGLTSGQHAAPETGEVPVIAPFTGAQTAGDRVRLTVSAADVRSAPTIARPDHLSPAEETTLRAHYEGTAAAGSRGQETYAQSTGLAPDAGRGTVGDATMTLSEEQLRVSTVTEPWARAVLRIEEYTEEVMVPVTVTRQRARVEQLPVTSVTGTPADGALTDQRSTSTSPWVTLYTEEPQVTMRRVPVERVRMTTSWVSEEAVVTDQVRREQVELTTTTDPV